MNFKISGKPTFEDYLKMVHRLSNRATFIALIGGLLLEGCFYFIQVV
ncbi:hypothetical protein KF7HA_02590 [Lactococcus lactis]|nr:hypothetical protein [Lactococcus lactis]